jgi:hypothetical protein
MISISLISGTRFMQGAHAIAGVNPFAAGFI